METKFIGLDGYNKIESVSGKKKNSKQIGTFKKTIRFVKRLFALIAHEHRASKAKKQHAHSAPTRNIIKKKAILTAMACVIAATLGCITVASALDSSPAEKPEVQSKINAQTNTIAPQTIDVASMPLNNDSTERDYNEISSSEIDNPELFMDLGYSALVIDGETIGITTEGDELQALLDQYLVDARKAYDEQTTTEFANSVSVTPATANPSQAMTADELMALAQGKLSVSLYTDWSYEVEMDYETNVSYDDTKDNTYKEVTKEGQNGIVTVNLKLNYVDGNLVDSVVTDTKVTKEAVAEEVTIGSKQGEQEYNSSTGTSGGTTGSFIWPVNHTHNITSYMEWRWGRMHNGLDIAGGGDYGQPIMASDGGVVTFAGNDGGGYGNYVMIDHGNGYMTVYGHASELACVTGQYVGQGETIAYIGSTGNSTGPHLHFEIRLNGEYQDPLNYVS